MANLLESMGCLPWAVCFRSFWMGSTCSRVCHPSPKQLPRPGTPPAIPTAIQSAYDSFVRCLQRADKECEVEVPELPKVEPPDEGSAEHPGGADFVSLRRKETSICQTSTTKSSLKKECDCIMVNPLAALDKRYGYNSVSNVFNIIVLTFFGADGSCMSTRASCFSGCLFRFRGLCHSPHISNHFTGYCNGE